MIAVVVAPASLSGFPVTHGMSDHTASFADPPQTQSYSR